MGIPTTQIKNLVLEGGGVKGIAYVGAIQKLADMGKLAHIEKVAGTSAGAITACLLALRYSAAEIYKIVFDLDFKSFEDGKRIFRVFTKYGIYRGDAFLKWMTKQIIAKSDLGLSTKATFADFQAVGCRELRVFATDIYTQKIQEFSYQTTPNTIVAEAVRSSMSIPIFFKAWQFSNSIPNDHLYVDGGVLLNFPINTFTEKGKHTTQTLGLHLDNLAGKPTVEAFGYNHVRKYIRSVFDTLLTAQVVDFENDAHEMLETVRIDDLGVSATDFALTDKIKKALIQQGSDAVEKHFG